MAHVTDHESTVHALVKLQQFKEAFQVPWPGNEAFGATHLRQRAIEALAGVGRHTQANRLEDAWKTHRCCWAYND